MAKLLRCRDVGPDCNFEVRGRTEEEILQKAGQHAQSMHKMQVTPQVVEAVRKAIRDE